MNGTWLLWVVATESLSVAASTLVPAWPSRSGLLAPVAVGLWNIGLVLYILLVSLILLHWLTVPMTPQTLSPPYWILMGATAIIVLAGVAHLAFMAPLSRFMLWVAVAAWAAVSAAFVARFRSASGFSLAGRLREKVSRW